MSERKPGPPAIGMYVTYGLYKIFASLIAALPREVALASGRVIGSLVYYLDGKHRTIALANLARAMGRSLSADERRRTARRSFANFVQSIFDVLKTAAWSQTRLMTIIDVRGGEYLEKAAAGGRGVLLFTAHYGNWEMVVPPVARRIPFHVIARSLDNPLVDRDLEKARIRKGATVVNKFGAGRPILRALIRKSAVGILIDQNVLRREAVFVDFFGSPAATTPALAVFHIRTGATILPMFCEPAPGNRYLMRFGPPVEVPISGDETADVLKITGICTKMIEETIRRNPAFWLWVHKRWQSRPSNEKP
ncbi:MAG: lysophospholipid acyltransferase family protein [Candidatus Aminicenantes bacterium]|nr:lysophospholipid acyltransferase family protein [Candidatus Aminicenantes bacterium]